MFKKTFNTCQKCGSKKIAVTNSRERDIYIWRRRKCEVCEHTFSTVEIRRADYDKLTGKPEMSEPER
jgi:transcriptional regulator NrdR family protein